jgi:PhnB protein
MVSMQLHPYINFRGKCAEAFRYYEKHLGGKIGMMMKFSEAPDQTGISVDLKDSILHADIALGGTRVLGADTPNAEPMRSAYLAVNMDSDAEAERAYAALAEGGQVLMPMAETFFAYRFGQVRDRFGVNWMIIHERPMQPPS